jgi:hypothetical protein
MFDANCAPILRQDSHYPQKDWIELSLVSRHLGVKSAASKTISEPMVCLGQTVHLTLKLTVSKEKEVRFHVTHITKEFYRVHLKRFLSLWHVWHKLCTYLAPRLALPPNGPKWPFTWALSPRSTIGCVQNNFLSRWHIGCKPCIDLGSTLTLPPKRKKWDYTWPMSPRSSIGCVQNDVRAYVTFDANRSPILCED